MWCTCFTKLVNLLLQRILLFLASSATCFCFKHLCSKDEAFCCCGFCLNFKTSSQSEKLSNFRIWTKRGEKYWVRIARSIWGFCIFWFLISYTPGETSQERDRNFWDPHLTAAAAAAARAANLGVRCPQKPSLAAQNALLTKLQINVDCTLITYLIHVI